MSKTNGAIINFHRTHDNFWLMKEIKKLTKIKPDLPVDLIKKVYIRYIKEDRLEYLKELKEFLETEMTLSINPVQRGYKKYARQGSLNKLRDLRNFSGIKPNEDVCRLIDIYKE